MRNRSVLAIVLMLVLFVNTMLSVVSGFMTVAQADFYNLKTPNGGSGWEISQLYAGDFHAVEMNHDLVKGLVQNTQSVGVVSWFNRPQESADTLPLMGFKVDENGQAFPTAPAFEMVDQGVNNVTSLSVITLANRPDLMLTVWVSDRTCDRCSGWIAIQAAIVGVQTLTVTGSIIDEANYLSGSVSGIQTDSDFAGWVASWVKDGRLWGIHGNGPYPLKQIPVELWGNESASVLASSWVGTDEFIVVTQTYEPHQEIRDCEVNWITPEVSCYRQELLLPTGFTVKSVHVLGDWPEKPIILEVNEDDAVSGIWWGAMQGGFNRIGFGENLTHVVIGGERAAILVWEKAGSGLSYAEVLPTGVVLESGVASAFVEDRNPVMVTVKGREVCFANIYQENSWWLNCRNFIDPIPEPTITSTPTSSPTMTLTPTATVTISATPVPTMTSTPTSTPTRIEIPTPRDITPETSVYLPLVIR